MNLQHIIAMGGSLKRTPNSVLAVSFYNIPGGTDYSMEDIVRVYFEDEGAASTFYAQHIYPPEAAWIEALDIGETE